jgi:hypothetical protein
MAKVTYEGNMALLRSITGFSTVSADFSIVWDVLPWCVVQQTGAGGGGGLEDTWQPGLLRAYSNRSVTDAGATGILLTVRVGASSLLRKLVQGVQILVHRQTKIMPCHPPVKESYTPKCDRCHIFRLRWGGGSGLHLFLGPCPGIQVQKTVCYFIEVRKLHWKLVRFDLNYLREEKF